MYPLQWQTAKEQAVSVGNQRASAFTSVLQWIFEANGGVTPAKGPETEVPGNPGGLHHAPRTNKRKSFSMCETAIRTLFWQPSSLIIRSITCWLKMSRLSSQELHWLYTWNTRKLYFLLIERAVIHPPRSPPFACSFKACFFKLSYIGIG